MQLIMRQITSIQGDQVILIGHRRIRMTEVVSRCLLYVLLLLAAPYVSSCAPSVLPYFPSSLIVKTVDLTFWVH